MNKMADFLFGKTGARHENAGAEDMSKTAMSHDEKMKYLKASIIAAVGAVLVMILVTKYSKSWLR